MNWLILGFFVANLLLASCETDFKDEENFVNDLLPGIYPTFRKIPKTGFTCLGKLNWNYYADLETDCQVFHICETQYSKLSFLCPVGSVFNQRHLVCDWWYNVECQDSAALYPENNNLIEGEPLFNLDSDLSLASSGDNENPKQENIKNQTSKPKRRN